MSYTDPEKARENNRLWFQRAQGDPTFRARRSEKNLQNRERYKLHPLPGSSERASRYARAYRLSNREKGIVTSRIWRQNNSERFRESRRKWEENQRQDNPEFRITKNLRRRVLLALRGNWKSAPTEALLGCSFIELRAHLETQFRPGMTWENYGPVWHIDHKRPCASFDLTDPAQQRICFNWSNLQPLLAEENYKKGAR